MVIVFDLDDTLYDELSFVRGGFKAVAQHLKRKFGLSERRTFEQMEKIRAKEGRGQIFDLLLQDYDLHTDRRVRECVSIYRSHRPKLRLFPEASKCLERFRGIPTYVVTDGNRNVQRSKASSLKLNRRFKRVLITHNFGVKRSKPSPYCFEKIARWERVDPSEVVYIGDNPHKDFVGIKPKGFKTVRVRTGGYRNVKLAKKFEAHLVIPSLRSLRPGVLEELVRR